MRTQTIFSAWQKTTPASPPPLQTYEHDRVRLRQNIAFQEEFERRMDHYDWYEARQCYFDDPTPERRIAMNEAYARYQSHPREYAKTAKWRKDNGI